MTTRSRRSTGILQVLLAVLSLSIAPILSKVGLAAAVDPVSLLATRLVVPALALWLLHAPVPAAGTHH